MPKRVPLSHGQHRPSVYEKGLSRDAESVDPSPSSRPRMSREASLQSFESLDEEWTQVFKPPKRNSSCPHLSSLVQGPAPRKGLDDIVKEEAEDSDPSDRNAGLLIPGLTNDLAIACLAKLPYGLLGPPRGVSRLWRLVLASEEFHKVRSLEGTTGTSFCVCLGVHRVGKSRAILFEALDFQAQMWVQLPPLYLSSFSLWRPGGAFENFSGFELVSLGRKLVLLGGAFHMPGDPLTEQRRNHRTLRKSSDVWAFDSVHHTWAALPSMSRPRSMFAAASLDRHRIMVAAGSRLDATAEVLDLTENVWRAAENMPYPGERCRGVVKDGLFLLIWHRHPFHGARLVHVYDPDMDAWSTVSGFFPSTGSLETSQPVAVLDGVLYATQGELQATLGGELAVLRNRSCGSPAAAAAAAHRVPRERQLDATASRAPPPPSPSPAGDEWEPVARLPRRLRERRAGEELWVRGHFLAAVDRKLIIVQTVVKKKIEDERDETFVLKEEHETERPMGFMSILSPPWWEGPSDSSVLAWEVQDVQISEGIVACAALSI